MWSGSDKMFQQGLLSALTLALEEEMEKERGALELMEFVVASAAKGVFLRPFST